MSSGTIVVVASYDASNLMDYTPTRARCRACGTETPWPSTADVDGYNVRHLPKCPVLRLAKLNSRGRGSTKGAKRALKHALALASLRDGTPS